MLIRTSNNEYSALPDTTSMGTQEKWVVGNRFYKLDPISGYDSLAEALVSELESHIVDLDFVDYFIDVPKTVEGERRRVCYSENCVPSGYTEVTLHKVLLSVYPDLKVLNKCVGKDFLERCIEVVKSQLGYNPIKYFAKVIYLDSITLNEDRHLNNISFLINKDGIATYMPILDNGRALLSDLSKYPLERSILSCIRRVKSKPFSTSFKKQVSYVADLYPPLVIDYESFKEVIETAKENLDTFTFKDVVATKVLRRMILVLLQNLKEQEGLTWVRK